MDQKAILAIMGEVQAVIADSHFVYTSGKHGSAYVNKDALYPHTFVTKQLCRLIAEHFRNDVIEAVVAPAIGGVILTQWVADHLTAITHREVLAIYAEKSGDGFAFNRGYGELIPGRNILVVEDILNTGGSASKVIKAVRDIDGVVIGLGALCNRGGVTAESLGGIPKLFALVDIALDAYDEKDCPLCKEGVPINVTVGKGKEFLAARESSKSGKGWGGGMSTSKK